jgi:hypothetical protein
MQSLSETSLTDFRSALTPAALQTLRVISLGLTLGLLSFGAVVLFLFLQQEGPGSPDDEQLMSILTTSVFGVTMMIVLTGRIVADRQYSDAYLQSAVRTVDGVGAGGLHMTSAGEQCLAIIRSTLIIRLALAEAVGYSGLTVTLVGVMTGAVYSQPAYLVNLAYPLIALVYITSAFPITERLEEIFARRIQKTG